ncbi:MAG: Gx transporter family protein [Clostridiales bacterium]|nr:Gx transporter family protein [Clostridiales bacterium]
MGEKFLTAKKLAAIGVLTALSLITFLIENLFPPLIIPGAKLGLANAFSFIALIMYSPVEAFIIVAARTLLGAMFAGNISAVIYSFTGGVVSMAASSLFIYCVHPSISVICASVIAAVLHNVTQNVVFVAVYSAPVAFSYLPYLILLGVLSGAFIGAAVTVLIKRIPTSAFVRLTGQK